MVAEPRDVPANVTSFPARIYWKDAVDILEAPYPPLQWIIPGVLPEGLTMLFSRPKVGKSMVASALGLRMALSKHGGVEGGVCILSLDDRSERRIQSRMRDMLGGLEIARDKLYFAFDALRLDEGLLQQLTWTMEEKPHVKMIVLDVYMSFRPKKSSGKDVVADDYQALAPLRQFALDHHIAVILLHHSRKTRGKADEGDWIDEINGSTGLLAACDTIWKLERDRNGYRMSLKQTGRDILDGTLHLSLSQLGGEWVQAIADGGEGEEPSKSEQKIVDALEAGETEVLGPQELSEVTGMAYGTVLSACRRLLAKNLVRQTTFGRYMAVEREVKIAKLQNDAVQQNAILQFSPGHTWTRECMGVCLRRVKPASGEVCPRCNLVCWEHDELGGAPLYICRHCHPRTGVNEEEG